MPFYKDQNIGDNKYSELFKKIFGINWRSMITLHKLLTLSESELVSALDYTLLLKNEKVISHENNIRYWVYYYLFENSLHLNDDSINYVRSILGLMCRDAPSFDFIAKERSINTNKSFMYKTLVFSTKNIELMKVMTRINRIIPEGVAN